MNIQLTKRAFDSKSSLDLVTKMIQEKIAYHEKQISKDANEEEIKNNEAKIKRLQLEHNELSNALTEKGNSAQFLSAFKIGKERLALIKTGFCLILMLSSLILTFASNKAVDSQLFASLGLISGVCAIKLVSKQKQPKKEM